ncbi:MAG: hypothetical protein ABSE06_01240 [Anaerolineaceae bacterium]|jgi:hypothetical protein
MQTYQMQDGGADFEMGEADSNEGFIAWLDGKQSIFIDREAGSVNVGGEKEVVVLIVNAINESAGESTSLYTFSEKLTKLLIAGLG